MNDIKMLTQEARSLVGKGWWPIIDEYLPQIVELAPECDIDVKEKYGILRINTVGSVVDPEKVLALEIAAMQESETVCEECGAPGTLRPDRTWIQTLCDQCAAKPSAETDQEDRVKNLFGQNQICDCATKALIDRPAERVSFYQELDDLCRKYGFSFAHEDEYGGFIIDDYKPENMTWLFDAAKRYDKKEE